MRPADTSTALRGQSIECAAVTKQWSGAAAVDGISLHVPQGTFTVLLGPSGCGKSTTLRMIAGLEAADGGKIAIGGRDVTRLPPASRDIAMVFQSYALFPHLTVAENIVFGLKVRRLPRAERDRRLRKVADLLGLSALLDRKPAQLSGGQQQRVALGRAIVSEKPVCLMDEPLSNLDAKLRHEMRIEIRALQRQIGFTMVYVTHDQIEAITMADQIVLMNKGRIEQVAAPRDIYARPASPFVARFIGTPPMNILTAAEIPGTAPDQAGLLLGVRPEALRIAEGARLRATVTAVEYLGADVLVDCTLGSQIMQVRVPGSQEIRVGSEVGLVAKETDLHVFDAETGGRLDERIHEFGPLLRP
ncbi:ABC transporter ATP-binding protein [Polymorphum gilvum]|uniref:ABC-type sugar transport systems, ATPase component protein n=1 Tax=Polymorphum gilvum (strain LMG 25793 / CGMCC 1.9160 / SL003B-26A1) TaxID=991905 RepID=F2IVR3_POLGS|nr:ABC transporter ATP-binding protein [Polymorphum gilvum]ADZ69170.1 ABC-type sugar transport systems, ATPase component protein [Polymorphum gilvum SL003B-26A1]